MKETTVGVVASVAPVDGGLCRAHPHGHTVLLRYVVKIAVDAVFDQSVGPEVGKQIA
jgi:hypothetical protein